MSVATAGGNTGRRLAFRGGQRPVQSVARSAQLRALQPRPVLASPASDCEVSRADTEVSNMATLSNYSDSSPEDETEESWEEPGRATGRSIRQRNVLCRCLQELIESEPWAIMVMSVILLNTLVMAVKCDFENWPVWDTIEDIFMIFFTVEICFRLCVYRLTFFTDKEEGGWNMFDLFIVLAGLFDLVATMILNSMNMEDNKVLDMLRTLRILRVLRSCRLLRHFKHLHMLVQGFMHSMQAVSWIAVLFISVVFVAGIVCTTLIGQRAEEWGPPDGSAEDVEQIHHYFGSLLRSMITMFQMVTLDDWADICGLVGKRSPAMILFFIAYTLITAFAMIALLTGVMTENVTSVSTESERQDEEKAFQMYVDTLESAFRTSSVDMDEGLTVEEFKKLLQQEEVKEGMALHHAKANFTEEDLTDVFRSLDTSGDGRVSWEEFRSGLKNVQGPASARQLAAARADVHRVTETLKGLMHSQPFTPVSGSLMAGGKEQLPAERLAAMQDQLRHLEQRLQEAGQAVTCKRSTSRSRTAR